MEAKRLYQPHDLLNRALERKQEHFSGYSRRSLARDLGVSPVFVSKILTGKKSIPADRVPRLCQLLDMDTTAQAALLNAMVVHSLPSDALREVAQKNPMKPSKMREYFSHSKKKFAILKDWYNIAILEFLTCSIDRSVENIAWKLGLTRSAVEKSLSGLEEAGLAAQENGQWIKVDQHGFFPTSKSQNEVRDFHKQMIQKAYAELSKSTQTDFDRRLITGFTIAVNPENLEKARRAIFDALSELSHTLSEGDCSDVYQCNLQLFPLTKPEGVIE